MGNVIAKGIIMTTTVELAGYRLYYVVDEHLTLQTVHNKCKEKLIISEDPSKRMGRDLIQYL